MNQRIKSWQFWRVLLMRSFWALLLGILTILGLNYWVTSSTEAAMYERLEEVPACPVALVLGTSRSINGIYENPFFSHRVQAAAALYHAGKVKHLLVSGDNQTANYNEPRDMQKALVSMGVPSSAITMDFAGLRTLDSVLRCKAIFGQDSVLIVSQAFHNARALFIAQRAGMKAWAFNAKNPEQPAPRTYFREYLARCAAVLDLYVFHTKPKHLGQPEPIVL